MHQVIIAHNTTVCQEGVYDTSGGDIIIHTGTVIHPGVTLKAISGPIQIGSNCIIEEGVSIINDGDIDKPLIIGSNCMLEFGSRVGAACKLGNGVILECKAQIQAACEVGDNVSIGAKCMINKGDTLADNTSVYGKECYRRTMHNGVVAVRQQTLHELLTFLRAQLPKGNEITQPTA